MNEPVDKLNANGSNTCPILSLTTELLILPDGAILVHNLTPAFAALLSELNPADEQIRPRVNRGERREDRTQTTDR